MAEPTKARAATPEELAFLNRKENREQAQQGVPAPAGLIPLLENDEIAQETWYDDPVMVSRMIIDGLAWGFSDEAVAALGAAKDRVFATEPNVSYQQFYQNRVNELEKSRNEYAEEFPVASIGLNIGGSLASGGVIAAALKRTGAAILPSVVNALPAGVRNVLGAGTVMSAEGAVSGIGYAQQGEDLSSAAAEGVITNLVFGTALRGAGSLYNSAAARRIQEPLTGVSETGETVFKPLTVASPESATTRLYTSVVNNTLFGARLLEQQTNRFRHPLIRNIEDARTALQDTPSMSSLVSSVDKQIKQAAKDLEDINKRTMTRFTQESVADLERDTQRLTQINAGRVARVEDVINNAERGFRSVAVSSSMPGASSQADLNQALSAETLQNTLASVRGFWDTQGFSVIKNRDFQIDPEDVVDEINSRLNTDMASFSLIFGGSPTKASELIGEYLSEVSVDGVISGARLSDLRTKVASMRGSLMEQGGEAAQRGYVLNEMVDVLNKRIESQLSKTELAQFQKDRTGWNSYLVLQDAIGKASTTPGRRGAFNAQEWLRASRSVNPRRFQEGDGILQREADYLGVMRSRADDTIKKIGEHVTLRKRQAAAAQKDVVNKQRMMIDMEAAAITRNATGGLNAEGQQRMAELIRSREALSEMETSLAQIDKALGTSNGGLVPAVALTGLVSTGNIPAAAAYLAVGRFLGTPTAQRLIAGQTQMQETMRRAAEVFPSETVTGAVGREAVRQDQQTLEVSEQDQVIRRGTQAAQAAAYRRLEARGALENLRQRNPRGFRVLEDAYKQETQQ